MKRFIEDLELEFIDGEEFEKYDSNNRYEVRDKNSGEALAVVNGNPFILNNWKDCTLICYDNVAKAMFINELQFHARFCHVKSYTLDNVYYDSNFRKATFLYSAFQRGRIVQYNVTCVRQANGIFKRHITLE